MDPLRGKRVLAEFRFNQRSTGQSIDDKEREQRRSIFEMKAPWGIV